MFVSADGQPQQLLWKHDLPLQQSFVNTTSFTDFDTTGLANLDTASFTEVLANLQSLLPAEEEPSLFVALSFQASIVCLQLFRCLHNHIEDFGGFGEFLVWH